MKISATFTALLAGIAAPVLAEDAARNFYVGLDAGQGRIQREYPGYSHSPGGNADALAWKLRFGRRLSAHWSVEAAYTDFGDYDGALMYALPAAAIGPSVVNFAAGDFTTSARGFDVSAIGTWPVNETFYLSAAAGLMRREMRTRHVPFSPGMPAMSAGDGDIAAQYGLGFGVSLGEAWDLSVNWVTTRNVDGDLEFLENRADPTLLSAGLRYRL